MDARTARPHLGFMDLDRLFGLVASLALLLFLLPAVLPLSAEGRRGVERAAGWLVGGALAAASLYAAAWFAGIV